MVRLPIVKGKKFWYVKGRREILREMRRWGLKTNGFRTRALARIEVALYRKKYEKEYGAPPADEEHASVCEVSSASADDEFDT